MAKNHEGDGFHPSDLTATQEREVIAAVLARLPYTTRLAIYHALAVQEYMPTDRANDDAAERLRRALAWAGVVEAGKVGRR